LFGLAWDICKLIVMDYSPDFLHKLREIPCPEAWISFSEVLLALVPKMDPVS